MQFLLGPSLLVTPVLEPRATTVKGIFPGIGEGTRWYDWYTLQEIRNVNPRENVTMEAPLEHINLHIRGGSILPLQKPGNTTSATRQNPYSLLVAPDTNGYAVGSLYLDDGESLNPSETKMVEFSYIQKHLTVRARGSYYAAAALADITILGLEEKPFYVKLDIGRNTVSNFKTKYSNGVLSIGGLDQYTERGAWESNLDLWLAS